MNPNNKNPNLNKKILLNLFYVFLTFVALLFGLGFAQSIEQNTDSRPTFTDLIAEIRQGKVSSIEVSENKLNLVAELYTSEEKNREQVERKTYPNLTVSTDRGGSTLENINRALGDQPLQVGNQPGQVIYTEKPKSLLTKTLENPAFQLFAQLAILIVIAGYIIKRLSDSSNRTISFGSSRAKMYNELENKDKVTFKDVAGQAEAKEELLEVVDFLKRPEEYVKMGAKIPKGVLLVGGPGNGKTLMAKAVAGEAGVPFLYVSGSEFVEMFVGVGAGRVRDLFNKAKKKNSCVIFIDEIDAVGRQRGTGNGGGNDEREQTLNQILVEMDGFEPSTSVIVIGATNRPDVLDPALLRPGRFDRQVTVNTPDRKERELILKVHSTNKKLAKDVDLSMVAKRTSGFSGADLMNVLNEAAILSVRERRQEITNNILREAVEKVILGPSLKSKLVTESQKKLTAYHEAGHALAATVLPKANTVQKITIIPRGRAAGYTFSDQGEEDAMTRTKSQFLADITVLFGGYTVEELIFGEVSTGASNDLSKATNIARNMVTKYGMSSLGPVSYSEDSGLTFIGRDGLDTRHYSDDTGKQIDAEVASILSSCHAECRKIITEYRQELDIIALALLEKEVLEFEEFRELVSHIANPPFEANEKPTPDLDRETVTKEDERNEEKLEVHKKPALPTIISG